MPFVHGLGNLACPCMVYIAVGKDSPRLQRMGMKSQHRLQTMPSLKWRESSRPILYKNGGKNVPENGKQLVAGLQEHL